MKSGKHTAAEDIGRVSAEVVGDLFGVSRTTFAKWCNEGILERQSPANGYDLRVVCRGLLAHYQRLAAGRGGEGGDALTRERVLLTRAKRRREELQAGIEAGQWGRLSSIQRFLEQRVMELRDRLLGLPGEAAYALAMRPQEECFEILDDFVRAKLEEISDPVGTAARAAAAGVEGKTDEPYRSVDDDEDEDELNEAK